MRSKSKELINEIIEFTNTHYEETHLFPTVREISAKLKISIGTVSNYLKYMKEEGILNNYDSSLKTKLMSKANSLVKYVPVVGSVACGSPILAEENIEEYLPIPKSFLGNGTYFILKAQGESMINAGISDGDYVIIRQQSSAEQGQIVVALVDFQATLKRYYIDEKRKQIKLHPENDNMEDMFFDNIIIQGVAIKVVKDLV